jgi:adenylosuccinate synthase
MSKVSCVIGANLGDEGKGLITDYLARVKGADLVVRFNGGAQAGHTVVTPEGDRHVFSHFGSGTFAGVPTFLSRYFILNPIIFRQEREKLLKKGFDPKVICDYRCMITTPWDMMWNQYLEEMRGDSKHGSCGVGIGATIDRYERNFNIQGTVHVDIVWLQYQMLINEATHSMKVVDPITEKYHGYIHDIGVYQKYREDLDYLAEHTEENWGNPFPKFGYAIFEGAQGLLLDQHMGDFPNVTRSNTGMRNVVKLQREMKFDLDEIVYVTRSYMTRHGSGPFKEFTTLPEGISDDTNVTNNWQDSIRFGPLGADKWGRLKDRIELDLASNGVQTAPKVAITHIDQYRNLDLPNVDYESHGPTWKDVCSLTTR